MSWELSFQVKYQPEGHGLMWFPAMSDEPYYSFDSLNELVESLKEMGRSAGLGGLDEYAEQVEREGEVIQRTLARRPRDAEAAVRKALERLARRSQPAEINPSAVTD
jgi:hypothetical protein